MPLRLVASTACFRKEAGSYGKDTKGMLRQHQFYKVELVSIVEPKKCKEELKRMTTCAEYILKELKLPYRTVFYQLEIWVSVLKKLLILKFGFLLKINTEKYQAVHLVDNFKAEE